MKKILIIDDKLLPNSDHTAADKWKVLVEEFINYVDVNRFPEKYFEWDRAGNYCNLKFNDDDYSYVFIHHSQKGDSYFPSNIMDFIKQNLREKLVLFSGNIEEKIIYEENPDFTFRSIKRENLSAKLLEFIRKSVLLQSWEIELLYYDYDKRLIMNIMKMIDNNVSKAEIIKSKDLEQFLALKFVKPDTELYYKVINEQDDLINTLRNL